MRSRALGAVALLCLLASCIPHGREPASPRRPGRRPPPSGPATHFQLPSMAPPPGADAPVTKACEADLDAMGVQYQPLPDRDYHNGCFAYGTVKLIAMGMPTTNLGAMTCPLARAFSHWATEALQPAAQAWLDAPVVKVESFGTFACRPVNNVEGGKLSEHGRSNAVDVSGFVLASGRRITVLGDWNGQDGGARNFLRAVHDSACRRFNVVLGPDANALHANHLHFDMGGTGGVGHYCR